MTIFERAPDVRVIFRFNNIRKTPVRNGYRPDHMIKNNYLTCGIHHYDNTEWVEPNSSAVGTITFIFPENYPHCLRVGKVINIHEGARVVGTAEITEILNPILIESEL